MWDIYIYIDIEWQSKNEIDYIFIQRKWRMLLKVVKVR